jgi:ornithine decarboxylase
MNAPLSSFDTPSLYPKMHTITDLTRPSAGIANFLEHCQLETPFLVVDASLVWAKYLELQRLFPNATVCYAMKANPHPSILKGLIQQGASFDVASWSEIETCLNLGANSTQLSYGNTIKKTKDISRAYAHGVRVFAFDSAMELEKIARHAPGSQVMCRLLTSSEHADWPLSRKFGCDQDMALELLTRAGRLGLQALGVCFHVGSQQMNPEAWDAPITLSARLFRALEKRGVQLEVLNLGGGFPAHYQLEPPPLSHYAAAIHYSLKRHFGSTPPALVLEPGRSMVADAGVLEAEVVLVSKKSAKDELRWVFLDVGKFGGLAETMDECIRYPIHSLREGARGPVVLAGPTCDSADILYEHHRYWLPQTLEAGDRVRFLSAGAYTSTYASVGFNGFAPLETHVIAGV